MMHRITLISNFMIGRITTILIITFLLFFQTNYATAQCCNYKLIMHDTYGDGWNGATLQVIINNESVGTYSASNFGSFASISICNGDSLAIIYTSGMYENENSYELQDSSWNIVFQDGPNPDTGIVFSTTGNCNTLLLQGSHPCTAIPIDMGQCVFTDNTGFPGTGLSPN